MTQDPYRYFRVEAQELLAELEGGALSLARGESTTAAVRRLLRATHTLKSAARVVRLVALGDRVHALEAELSPYRDHEGTLPAAITTTLRDQLELVGREIRGLDSPAPTREPTRAPAAVPTTDATRLVRAELREIDELVEGLADVQRSLAVAHAGREHVERARQLGLALAQQLGARQRASDAAWRAAVTLVDELVAALGTAESMLGPGVDRVARELAESRDAADRLRLVPAGALFDLLERTALDAARALGRSVRVHTRGAEVRLDAHVLAHLQSALVQIVRNAVVHGLEPEPERRRAGKPIEGLLELEVARHGSRLVLSCRDDGRGVDLDAVRRAARRKGDGRGVSDDASAEEVLARLLRGGLSTATAVDVHAGRGVGLDVVRSATESLGGEVRVQTQAGHGTTVTLSVPLQMAAIDALIVLAGGQPFAFPLDVVRGVRRIQPGERAREAGGELVAVDRGTVPFTSLARSLGKEGRDAPARATTAVLVGLADEVVALAVEGLVGTAHVLVRPLPDEAAGDGTVAGIAIDARGDVVMVLDAASVLARARDLPCEASRPVTPARILVCDDSLTTRMLEKSILESAGYEVDLAVSGEEALARLSHARYALLLVDVEMPGIDGFEVLRRLRASAHTREMPAILVTSRDAPEDRALGREVGADDYVVKSEFDQSALLERIGRLVRR